MINKRITNIERLKFIGEVLYIVYLYIAVLWVVYAFFAGGLDLIKNYTEGKLIMWFALFHLLNIWVDTYKKLRKYED